MELPVKDFVLLIPYYNNYSGLLRSLNSVHYPSTAYEILIIDDGSSVPITHEQLTSDLQKPLPVRIISLNVNNGITFALNKGLAEIKLQNVKFIARLDCGDICSPQRFTKQIDYLILHPDVALIGTGVRFKNYITDESYVYKNKNEHTAILRQMHFRCSFIHPSVMFKKALINEIGLYPEDFKTCEDYAYFFKIVKQYQTYILPEVLVTCEINSKGISAANRNKQLLTRLKVINHFGTSFLSKFAGSVQVLLIFVTPLSVVNFLKKR